MEEPTSRIGIDMDRTLTNVMPDSWHGHARLLIAGAEVSDKERAFAEELSRRLLEKGKVSDANKAAKLALEQAQEKLD